MNLPLETDRLILRPFREADILAFSDYRSDPQVARYQGWSAPFTLEQAGTFIREMLPIKPGQPGHWYQVALERREDGVLIGDCAFYLSEDNRQAEIAFTLASAFQGQGYAAEAVKRLLEALFIGLQLHRVFANVDPANTGSINLLTRLGFRCEGCFRKSLWLKGGWLDEQWYALLQEDWLAARAQS